MKLAKIFGEGFVRRLFGTRTGAGSAGRTGSASKVGERVALATDKILLSEIAPVEKEAASAAAAAAKEGHKLGKFFDAGMQSGNVLGIVFGSEALVEGLQAERAGLERIGKILAGQTTGRSRRMRQVAGDALAAIGRIETEASAKATGGGAGDLLILLPAAKDMHAEAIGALTRIAELGGVKVELPKIVAPAAKVAAKVTEDPVDVLRRTAIDTVADAVRVAREYVKLGQSSEARRVLERAPVRRGEEIAVVAKALKEAEVFSSTAADILSRMTGRISRGGEVAKLAAALKEAGYQSDASVQVLRAAARNLDATELGEVATGMKSAGFWADDIVEVLSAAAGRIGSAEQLQTLGSGLRNAHLYDSDKVKILAEPARRLGTADPKAVTAALEKAGLFSWDIEKLLAG